MVDAGAWSDVNPIYGGMKSDFIFKTMKRMGYDAVTLGDREIRQGVKHHMELAAGSPRILVNNLTDESGTPLGDDVFQKEIDGVKVGVFGLVHKNIVERAPGNPDKVKAEDVFTAADRIIQRLQKDQCDVIVMLAQMEIAFADSLVRRHPEIDLAVLGHQAGLRATHGTIGNTIVVRSGNRAQHIAWVDLDVDAQGNVVEFGGRSVPLDDKAARKDAQVQTLVNEMKAEIERLQKEDRLLHQTEFKNQQAVDRYLGAEACARCHQPEYEAWKKTPHANAWNTLVEAGMDTNEECVSCHVTGKGKATGFESVRMKPDLTNVQCESCHVMGTLHAVGDEKAEVTASACVSCHDAANSPEFDARSYMAKIKHW